MKIRIEGTQNEITDFLCGNQFSDFVKSVLPNGRIVSQSKLYPNLNNGLFISPGTFRVYVDIEAAN